MAATTISAFNGATKQIMGAVDLNTSTLKLALVTSAYTFSSATADWASISANEVAAGNGYTTGGETITGATLTSTGAICAFDANDVTFTALTKTFRAGVVYASGTFETIIDPVLFYILFDSAPADKIIESIDFIVKWNASGILTI